jgi:alpha-L-fucosidase
MSILKNARPTPADQLPPVPPERHAARKAFAGQKYGLFLHYGLYSLLGRHEWVQEKERIPVAEYAKLADEFAADQFDAKAWVDFAKAAGMRYINLTTRHHDSFSLWPTRQNDFHAAAAPKCRRDLVGELAQACHAGGVGLCLYYSHGRDWRHPQAPNNDTHGYGARPSYPTPEPAYATGRDHDLNRYVDFMAAQVEELLTDYGPIQAIWLDGIATPLHPIRSGEIRQDFDPRTEPDPFRCQELYDLVHRLQPECLVSYKQGYLGTEDFFAPEHEAYNRFGQPFGEVFGEVVGEVCTTMITEPRSWGYHAGDDVKHLNADGVWQALQRADAARCNLLLNTGPLPDGSLDPRDEQPLLEVGQRLAQQSAWGQPSP